ncbi:MAG: hypothetical protein HKM04_11765 [Legionellales bacterium]|nr:hypothetical protein [Legionellales bacterium]
MDIDILYGLHPVQACFLGIAYTQDNETPTTVLSLDTEIAKKLNKYEYSRYGQYQLTYQQQKRLIGFICKKTQKPFLMDARDIALSQELIGEFDAIEAFIIGQEAGRQLNDSKKQAAVNSTAGKTYLRLVK